LCDKNFLLHNPEKKFIIYMGKGLTNRPECDKIVSRTFSDLATLAHRIT